MNENQTQNAVVEMPPIAEVMQMMLAGWVSKTISEVSRLNIPDILVEHGPLNAEVLTSQHQVKADTKFLHRILRALASVGIFTENVNGEFGSTPLSEVLTKSSAVSAKALVELTGASTYRVWGGLGNAIKEGQPQSKNILGMEYWDYLKANPTELEEFAQAMKSNSNNSLQGVVDNCDFSTVNKIIDVAGGLGHLAIALLKKYENLKATVIDMPNLESAVMKNLQSYDGVTSRFNFVGGNMFDDVPSGNVYILKHIIHDWDDESCLKLLKLCHARMEGDGRIICVDAVLPPLGDVSNKVAKFLDINMLVLISGKERMKQEWEHLYEQAGFKITLIIPLLDNFGTSIIEGVKK